jgi:purine-binding chemotaxis protein CheW
MEQFDRVSTHTRTVGVTGRELLKFSVSGHACALRLSLVSEVLPYAHLTRPPGLPSVLDGFLNLGGTAVAVLRLDRLFDFPPTPVSLYTPLVVLRAEGPPAALLVDSVAGVICPPAEALVPLRDQNSFNGCAEAEILMPDGTVHLLSPARLLLEQERLAIGELQQRTQTYLDELAGAQA